LPSNETLNITPQYKDRLKFDGKNIFSAFYLSVISSHLKPILNQSNISNDFNSKIANQLQRFEDQDITYDAYKCLLMRPTSKKVIRKIS